MDTQKDRRETKRYPIQCGAFIYLKRTPSFPFKKTSYIQLGPVSDISFKGISVQYISEKLQDVISPSSYPELAISTSSGKIIIDDVKYEPVYDWEIAAMPDGKNIRRKALKFLELSGYQSAWLACLIHNLKSRQIEIPYKTNPEDKPAILNGIF